MALDVTEIIEGYRLALRHIWNSHFWSDQACRQSQWESVDSFRLLKQPLFNALIADRVGLEHQDTLFGRDFRVVPTAGDGTELPFLEVNLRVPSSPDGGIWNQLIGPFKADEIALTLIDLFDWSPVGYIDLRYFVVLIESFTKYPEKVGHHALVEVVHAKVLLGSGEVVSE